MKKNRLLPFLLVLFFAFFIWQIIFILSSGTQNIMTAILKSGIHIPVRVIFPNLLFWGIQITLYFLLAVFTWCIARLSAKQLKLSWKKTTTLGFYLFLIISLWLLLLNRLQFPYSHFSVNLVSVFLPVFLVKIIFYVLSVALCLILLLAFIQLCVKAKNIPKKTYLIVVFLICILIAGHFVFCKKTALMPKPTTRPNVFIIGIDALRPDYVGYYHQRAHSLTPHLDKQLEKSINFTETLTPLARTFPSWISLLSGQYPKHTHARFNLTERHLLNLNNTLEEILNKQGYHTIYATDDERFSNITKPFGFNQVIGPKIGVNDFLLGALNDFPLSNLLVNTSVGRFLYPYSHANRAAYTLYQPNTFNRLVTRHLVQLNDRPVFMCIHFCLTHWPYVWGSGPYLKNMDNKKAYPLAIKRVDKQVNDFLIFLKANGFLKNAIVVFISDHGETLGYSSDRIISKKKYVGHSKNKKALFQRLEALSSGHHHSLNISVGHGTDILSPKQYHSVMAFRFYGKRNYQPKNIHGLASLMDIKPTLFDALNLPQKNTDGISLMPYVRSQKTYPLNRFMFTETGLTPKAIDSENISLINAVLQSINLFGINPQDTHVYTKPTSISLILKSKQRAITYKNWMLAIYPMKNRKPIVILANMKTKKWTTDLHDAFSKKSPAKLMIKKMKAFYGSEIGDII